MVRYPSARPTGLGAPISFLLHRYSASATGYSAGAEVPVACILGHLWGLLAGFGVAVRAFLLSTLWYLQVQVGEGDYEYNTGEKQGGSEPVEHGCGKVIGSTDLPGVDFPSVYLPDSPSKGQVAREV